MLAPCGQRATAIFCSRDYSQGGRCRRHLEALGLHFDSGPIRFGTYRFAGYSRNFIKMRMTYQNMRATAEKSASDAAT